MSNFQISPGKLAAVTFLAYAIATFAGHYQITPWSQVVHLWEHGWTIANWHVPITDPVVDGLRAESVQHDAHRLRYFLAYPLFLASVHGGVGAESVFSAVAPFLVAISIWSAATIVDNRSGHALHLSGLVALLPIACIFAAMDGRLVFAHCGYAVLLVSHLSKASQNLYVATVGSAIGIFLASVSSGTLYSALAALVVLTLCAVIQASSHLERMTKLVPLLFCTVLYQADFAAALLKNLAYYGGGLHAWEGMLGHGIGTLLVEAKGLTIKFVAVVTVLALASLCFYWVLRRQFEVSLCVVLLSSVAMGVFGYSALSLAIVPSCLLLSIGFQTPRFSQLPRPADR